MYQSYDLSRYFEGDLAQSTSITVSSDDAINCAHMLAAGFNTMSRKMMGDFVLAVVDTKAGTVQYDGKIEKIERPDPWSISHSFTFEPSAGDADTILTLFSNGETPTFTAAGKMSFVEESHEPERAEANASARDELIEHVKGAYDKWSRIDPERDRDNLKSHLRGMIEVLSKFLAVIGEADDDERHAVAKRLCGIPEGSYLYED